MGSASSGAAAPRIKMLGVDRLKSDPRRQRGRWRTEGGVLAVVARRVAEDVVVVDWGDPTKPPSVAMIGACNEGL